MTHVARVTHYTGVSVEYSVAYNTGVTCVISVNVLKYKYSTSQVGQEGPT